MSVGAWHACALHESGSINCWGDNTDGKLGVGFAAGPVLEPTKVLNLAGATEVEVSSAPTARHVCASNAEGSWCGGANFDAGHWTHFRGELGRSKLKNNMLIFFKIDLKTGKTKFTSIIIKQKITIVD